MELEGEEERGGEKEKGGKGGGRGKLDNYRFKEKYV